MKKSDTSINLIKMALIVVGLSGCFTLSQREWIMWIKLHEKEGKLLLAVSMNTPDRQQFENCVIAKWAKGTDPDLSEVIKEFAARLSKGEEVIDLTASLQRCLPKTLKPKNAYERVDSEGSLKFSKEKMKE